jgi:phospholipid transport system substrate-binding protein
MKLTSLLAAACLLSAAIVFAQQPAQEPAAAKPAPAGAPADQGRANAANPPPSEPGTEQLGPRELIERGAKKMLEELDANRAAYKKNPKLVGKLVDEVLLPDFDTRYAARQVLGRHWRNATPEQRERFIQAFYNALVENYGAALLEFTGDKLEILPFRGNPNAEKATVKTIVKTSNGTRVPVDYTMRKTPDGWKAWDVVIEGISYVNNFRNDFGAEIDQKGLEAVITRLEREGPPKVRKSA